MRLVALLVSLLTASASFAQAVAFRAGPGIQMTTGASLPTTIAGRRTLWVDSSNRLRFWNGTDSTYPSTIAATTKGDLSVFTGSAWGRLAAGTNNYCLVADSAEVTGLKWASCSAATGYQTIKDEGSSLTQRTILNFTGAGVSCVDNAGATRTDCTISSGGSTGNWTFTGDAADDSGAAVLTIGATTATGVTIGRTAGANILAADTTLASGKTLTGAAASDLYLNAVTGQLVRLRVNGSNMLSVSSTAATLTVPLVMTGTQTGTYTLGGTPTITAPVISGGLTASGSASNDFSASTGTFKTSTGTLTVSGDLQMASGKHIYGGGSTSAADFSAGSGIFKTTTGAATFEGSSNYFNFGLTSASDVIPSADNAKALGNSGARWIAYTSQIAAYGPTVGTTIGSSDGIVSLANLTAATAGNQKYSPALSWQGNGWKTNATAGSQAVQFVAQVIPVEGAANPTGGLSFQSSINGSGFTERLNVGSTAILASVPITANLGATTVAPTWIPFAGGGSCGASTAYCNSYVDFGGGTWSNSGYYKDAFGTVHVRLSAKSGTAGAVIFTLPAGYRPGGKRVWYGLADGGGTSSSNCTTILVNGDIQMCGGGTTNAFSSIEFAAEN